VDEAEREGIGSLEPLVVGGSEVSTPMSLYDYGVDEYPVIAKRFLLGEIKLTALIAASDSAYYFLPENEFKQASEAVEIFAKGIWAKTKGVYAKTPSDSEKMNEYRAETGTYVILDIESVARNLDEIFAEGYSDEEVWIEFSFSLSPKGIRGLLVDVAAGPQLTAIIQTPSIYCSRILLEEITTSNESKRQVSTEVDFILKKFLDVTNGTGGKAQLIRYMTDTVGAEFLHGEKWKWKDPTGKPHIKSAKRLLNRLSQLKKEYKKQE